MFFLIFSECLPESDNESGRSALYPLKRKHKSAVEHGDDETANDEFSNSDQEESGKSDDEDTSDESDGERSVNFTYMDHSSCFPKGKSSLV